MRKREQLASSAGSLFARASLRGKAARGGLLVGSGSAMEQVARFLRNMLLARLLAPADFGAMAIVLSSSSLIVSLSDIGILPAVIHHPQGGDDEYLDAAWWLGVIRVIFIYILIFIAAPWIASFYALPALSALLRVTLLGIILDGLISPRTKLMQKTMRFARVATITNGGAICGVIVTVALSFALHNVWALAFGYCAENAFRCLISYVICPGLPSLKIDMHAVRDLWVFTRGMLGLSFFNLIFSRTDIFVLGKLYSSDRLGLYTMAVTLVQTPAIFIINAMSAVLMPAFAQTQADKTRTSRILSEATSWVLLAGFPTVAMLWLGGSSVLRLAYGARYSASSTAFSLAACVALFNVLNSLITALFFAVGRPELHRRAVALSAIVMIAAIYPACRWLGPTGGQAAALVAIIGSYIMQLGRGRAIMGKSTFFRYGRSLGPAILAAIGVLATGFGARALGLDVTPAQNVAVAVLAGILGYLLSFFMLHYMRQTRERHPDLFRSQE